MSNTEHIIKTSSGSVIKSIDVTTPNLTDIKIESTIPTEICISCLRVSQTTHETYKSNIIKTGVYMCGECYVALQKFLNKK